MSETLAAQLGLTDDSAKALAAAYFPVPIKPWQKVEGLPRVVARADAKAIFAILGVDMRNIVAVTVDMNEVTITRNVRDAAGRTVSMDGEVARVTHAIPIV